MLEFLASVDPMALPLWAVLAFSAAMFPIGILLPCGKCCGCNLCPDDTKLPGTITVTISGMPERTQGPDLITLSIQACFGSGAAARVTAPGGDPDADAGPISKVEVTSGGSGYAKLARVEPATVSAAGGTGEGATLTVTLAEDADGCGVPFWKVDSIAVSGGTGYADGDAVTFTVADGDTEEQAANATIHTTRNEPTLEITAPTGSGATFSVSYTKNGGPPPTWSIASISVTDGGTGYHNGDSLSVSLGEDDVESYSAYAVIRTGRLEPTLTASVSSDTGSDAVLAVSLNKISDYYGDTWEVSDITITDGGTGYAEYDPVTVAETDGPLSESGYFYAYVSSVDETGAITAITIQYNGPYYKDDGIIASVDLWDGGSYYKDDGVPVSVSVEGGGVYYREDADAEPYVADVTISLYQTSPSDGTGAVLSAVVGSDPDNQATFGKITAIMVDDGGDDGYLAWEWMNTKCCGTHYHGKSFVLKRGSRTTENYITGERDSYTASQCEYLHKFCGVGNLDQTRGSILVKYLGPTVPPVVELRSELRNNSSDSTPSTLCSTIFTSTTLITDCSEFSFTAGSATGATATVSVGGDYDEDYLAKSCFICCKGDDELAQEVTASFAGADAFFQQYDGDYVLQFHSAINNQYWDTPYQADAYWWCGVPDILPEGGVPPKLSRIEARLKACSLQSKDGFSPLIERGHVCDDCHNKCLTEVGVWSYTYFSASGGGTAPSFQSHRVGALLDPGDPWNFGVEYLYCDELCEATPQCRPAAGAYAVRFYQCFGGGFGCTNYPIGTVTLS